MATLDGQVGVTQTLRMPRYTIQTHKRVAGCDARTRAGACQIHYWSLGLGRRLLDQALQPLHQLICCVERVRPLGHPAGICNVAVRGGRSKEVGHVVGGSGALVLGYRPVLCKGRGRVQE